MLDQQITAALEAGPLSFHDLRRAVELKETPPDLYHFRRALRRLEQRGEIWRDLATGRRRYTIGA